MTVFLGDLFDILDLDTALEAGFVRQQVSPDATLGILNYTELATYSKTWTSVTIQCRGLIYRLEDQQVIARPLPKFWNVGEHAEGTLDFAAPVEVTEKMDGSLGILYFTPDGPAIATRGSFTSEQAQHATALYRYRYDGAWDPEDGWTYLYEILYPENRIVVDYGDTDDLVLLGAIHIATGRSIGPLEASHAPEWPGPVAITHPYPTLADALAAPPRDNAEGYVIRYLSGEHADVRVKLKHDAYVALHRILTGMTARRLWERAAIWDIIATGEERGHTYPPRQIAQILRLDPADVKGILDAGPDWADEVKRTAPEEFWEWIESTTQGLRDQVVEILTLVAGEAFGHHGRERRDIARDIADHPYRGMVFAALDGKPYLAQAWAAVRPAAEKPFAARGEDVA